MAKRPPKTTGGKRPIEIPDPHFDIKAMHLRWRERLRWRLRYVVRPSPLS